MSNVYDVFKELEREQQMQTFAEGEETIDSNNYCMLESDTTRKILIPEKYSIFGVESDEKVKTVKFAFPRYVDDGRLDLMNYQIRINYKTANPNEESNKDQTRAQNVHTVGDYIVFDWLLSRRVTQYKGTITFIVCVITANDDGTITTEWNTTLATSQSIEGLEVSPNENEEEQARDLLTELLANLNNSKNDAIAEITQTKTQAISDIEAEGQTQINAVDAKGAQVLESIPDDYTTLEGRVDELEQNRAYVIVGNGSGEFVTLNDSSELKTRNVKLFGKSAQAETTGVQLFNINKLKELDDGIEIIDYSTGEMEISQQSNAMLPVRLFDICPNMIGGQTYSLTGETTSKNKYLRVGAKQWNFDESFVPEESDLLAQCNFVCTTQTGQSGEIIYYKDTFKHIMIVEGSTEKPYEVYTGGEAATEPTPEFPLPITSAGNYDEGSGKYEIGVSVMGAQLLKLQDVNRTESGITVSTLEDGGYKVTGRTTESRGYYIRVSDNLNLQKGTYTLSQKFVGSGNCFFYDDGFNFLPNNVETKTKTFDKQIIVKPYIYVKTNSDIDCIIYPMINVGDKLLPFELFKQQLSTLQLPNPLRGIPVDSGGNYTDADGQQWICDYIDRERGKYVQCVQEIVFDGDEDENWSIYNNGFYIYGGFDNSTITDLSNQKLMCDTFPISTTGDYPRAQKETSLGKLSIIFYNTGIESVSAWKVWLQNNPITVVYPLATPTVTNLTADQLAALNLSTYQGITNIGTDTMPQAGIDVEYIADTKTYIDNAIAEAIAAIPTE